MTSRGFSTDAHYLWDPWFSMVGLDCHVFFLQAPRSVSPEERHHHSSIGHAVSRDLRNWEAWPTALTPSELGAFDDRALWTGCTFTARGEHYLFYTGRTMERFWRQSIGLARSRDLRTWERVGTAPILLPDAAVYTGDREVNALGYPQAWRDPFVFCCPESGDYLMTITAEARGGDQPYNGCVALARSSNLVDWSYDVPLFAPGTYAQIEVTQVIFRAGRCYLFFSCPREACHPSLKLGSDSGRWHCYISDVFRGEFRPANGDGVVPIADKSIYNARLIRPDSDGSFVSMGWHAENGGGDFVGTLSEPFRTIIDGDTVHTAPL